MSLQQLEWLIREKVRMETIRSPDPLRDAFRLFTSSSGITPLEFEKTLIKLGITTSNDTRQLFQQLDTDKNGEIDVYELQRALLPHLSSRRGGTAIRKQHRIVQQQKQAAQSVQGQWSVSEMEQKIRRKIEQHTSRSSDCFRQAYRIFKKSRGIQLDDFHKGLALLGLELTHEQAKAMFQRYDTDQSGDIDLHEFVIGILGRDYAQVGPKTPDLATIQAQIQLKIQKRVGAKSTSFFHAMQQLKTRQDVQLAQFDATLHFLGCTNLTPEQKQQLFQQSLHPPPAALNPSRPASSMVKKKRAILRRR